MLTGLDVVDIPVNNAGGSHSFKELHVPEAAWQEAITLNFHRARQLGNALIDGVVVQRWSRVVNITGKSEPERVNGAFCAQAALHGCAKGLSRMGAARRHGALHSPGRIHSEQILRNHTPGYRRWQVGHQIPTGRYGEPEHIADLVCFLASPLAGCITCAVIPVDGGLRLYRFPCPLPGATGGRPRTGRRRHPMTPQRRTLLAAAALAKPAQPA